eukprot:3403425-Amphidinium_carterae.1
MVVKEIITQMLFLAGVLTIAVHSLASSRKLQAQGYALLKVLVSEIPGRRPEGTKFSTEDVL